jgi:hypothetical protein
MPVWRRGKQKALKRPLVCGFNAHYGEFYRHFPENPAAHQA